MNLKCRIAEVECGRRSIGTPSPRGVSGVARPVLRRRPLGSGDGGAEPAAKMSSAAKREPSFKVTSEEIAATNAEIIHHYALRLRCRKKRGRIPEPCSCLIRGKNFLRAATIGFFAIDANSYSSRPGPRLADGLELFAHLFHPEFVFREIAFRRLSETVIWLAERSVPRIPSPQVKMFIRDGDAPCRD